MAYEIHRPNATETYDLVDLDARTRANPTVARIYDKGLAERIRDLLNAGDDPHALSAVLEGCTRAEAKALNHGAPLRNVLLQGEADARAQ